jgi:hypothetical protein
MQNSFKMMKTCQLSINKKPNKGGKKSIRWKDTSSSTLKIVQRGQIATLMKRNQILEHPPPKL